MQTTLSTDVIFKGIGLHSGQPVEMVVRPAHANSGISFHRIDLQSAPVLPARFDMVSDTRLCTKLGSGRNSVGTIEHIMAALAGCGIHNAYITLNGPEVPIMDGSSAEFVAGILDAGIFELDAKIKVLKILKPMRFEDEGGYAELWPCANPKISFEIEFDVPIIGRQSKNLSMANGSFIRELCNSRTFCKKVDVDYMQANGLGLGGSLENAVVVDDEKVLNPTGFRHSDECVRHKMLDALGDLYLAGGPILGHYVGHKAGHRITNKLLRVLLANQEAFEWIDCDMGTACLLPGSDLKESDLALIA